MYRKATTILALFLTLSLTPVADSSSLSGQILFYSYRDGNPDLYVMEPDGSNPTRLTYDAPYEYSPLWSPDGTRIAFIAGGALNVIGADGSGRAVVVEKLMPHQYLGPQMTWSPDGKKIAFTMTEGKKNDIFVVNADGTGLTNLTASANEEFNPIWAPDGETIYYNASYFDLNLFRKPKSGIYAIGVNDRKTRQICGGLLLDLSPNGKDLAVLAAETHTSPGGNVTSTISKLYRQNSDGSGKMHEMTSLRDPPYQLSPTWVRWSPDGLYLAYLEGGSLYMITRAGGGKTRLTPANSFSWSPDGSMIVCGDGEERISLLGVISLPSGDQQTSLFLVNVADKTVTVLSRGNKDFIPRWSPR